MSILALVRKWMGRLHWIWLELWMVKGAGVGRVSLGFVILEWNAYSIVVHGAKFKHFLKNLDVVCIEDIFEKVG